ncbi:hypothetical protein Tco_0246399 [Tanacetum coccineum]
MLLLSLRAILHFSLLQMFLKFTCTNSGILSTSMKITTGSEWINRRNSTSIWKSSETSFRSALEFMVKTLMNFPLMKILCLSSKNLVILGKSSQSPILLLIRCINHGKLLPLSSTEVYLERQLVLTSFIFLEHKSFEECTIRRMWTLLNYFGKISLTRLTTEVIKSKTRCTTLDSTKVIIHHFLTTDKTISKRNKIGMHTSRDDYLINTLRFVSAKEESQIYGARLPKSMTSPEMRETKAYKTYIGYATRVTPPKKARKFKKPSSPKLSIV